MFSRGNIASKYKNYVKQAKALKDKIQAEKAPIIHARIINNYEKAAETLQARKELGNALHTTLKLKETLSVVQEKLDKYPRTVSASKSILRSPVKSCVIRRLVKNPAKSAILGAGFFSSSPVTIEGYSSYDLSILKQLGVVDGGRDANEPPTNTLNSASETTHESERTNESPPVEQMNDSSPVEEVNNDFPLPLYDVQGDSPYHSIFDNMPPENARNDIYTTIYNSFNRQTDESHFNSSENGSLDGVLETLSQTYNVVSLDGSMNDAISQQTEPQDGVVNVMLDGTETANISDMVTKSSVVENDGSATNSDSLLTEPIVEAIPEPPAVPDIAAEAASQLNALGENTFASLGLGGWTPVGIVQDIFEYLHVGLGIPWWEAICIGTLVIRFMMFPLVIMAQRNAAKMNNHLPGMQVLQLKMTEARQSGNQMEAARYSQELMTFMKEKNLNPLKNMIVPLAQMPVFISFFVGLRQMANVPVDSLRTGGLFWFTDLTVPDQFFALPVITSLTLWATIELGTDSAKLSSQNLQTMKYVLRALPFVILPFTVNFPGAILCYWVSSNFISLAQVGFLKIPAVRDYFKIDPLLKHDPQKLPVKNKGFVGGIKDSWTNIKITKELEERRRLDDLQFKRAGKGPLVKTYKYDPTKQVDKGAPAISAKNR